MIRCPTCGTLNQDSRKSCSNCGKTLPQTKIRCPKCGTLNSVGNLLCDNCNARLVQPEGIIPSDLPAESDSRAGSSPVKGISLPTRATVNDSDVAHTGEDELPDWLRDLTEDSEGFFGAAGESTEEPKEDKGDTSSGYPDWLSGLLDENADFGAAEEAGEPEPERQDELTFEANALPDWFAGEAAPDDELTPDSADDSLSELPDWLLTTADTGGSPAEASDTPDLPDWLTASAEATPAETPMDSELPDWLTEAQIPTADTTSDDAYGPSASTDSLDVETQPATSEPLARPSTAPQLSADLPDWLAEAQTPTADTTSNDAYGPSASTDTPDVETQPATHEPLTRPSAEPQLSADLPDWLSTVGDGEDSGNTSLPDWLPEPSDTPAPDPSAQPHARPPGAWEEDAAAAASEAGEAATTDAPEMPTTSPASPEPEPADLPEWLSDLGGDPVALGGAAIFAGDDEIPEEPAAQPQEKPDWLEEKKPATEIAQYELTAPAFVQGDTAIDGEEELAPSEGDPSEMPDWLRGLDFSSPVQPQAPSDIFEGDVPAPAELPSWLQELKLQSPPAAVLGISDEPVNADIPDWLHALRPEPGEAGEAPPRRVALPTPAEPEGPLQGVPGVLQPFASIDAPADIKTVTEIAIPEAVIAQAQLWQRLLERPRSAERPVSHARPHSKAAATLIRLLVAAILTLGVLGAFLLLPEELRLATALPAQIAPGAPALIEGLNALQPGDRVIVAVEYGIAYAEEMSQIAIPVLQQLTEQQAEITIVSTLPEGAVLGATLAAEAESLTAEAEALAVEAETPAEPAQLDGGYLAGNASGISAFLSQPDAQAARHVLILASRPERLRWWIEQVRLAYDSAPTPVSLSVGVSASAGPIVAPYLRTLQIQGWLVGLPDALAYRELRGVEDTDNAARALDVLMLAHWAAGGLLVIGLFVSLVAGKKGAR